MSSPLRLPSRQDVDQRTRSLQSPSSAAILASHVEPKDDMVAERKRSDLDVEHLSYLLNGGKEALDKRHAFAAALAATPWGDKTRRHFLEREEEYVGALRGALGIWAKMRKEKISIEDGVVMRSLLDFPGGLELHIGMFMPSLMSQGTQEQQALWMPQCFALQIIGTYAQTELGHGTFVRGLETTATFDPQTDEFVIHSPTLSSTKWWPGGMGKTATHAVVMARLFTKGKDYGPHAFIVQLRCLQTHLPMPGVTVGDIGPKFGYNGVDNGFMSMDHVRIPRNNMLMRFASVSADGTYKPPPPANVKASYATMLYVRADIVKNAGGVLAKAVTIATRYAAVRRQTAFGPGQKEVQVLDYQNVSHTLLPLVASAYALHFTAQSMVAMYKAFESGRDAGDFSSLPELHALSSGLKALCTGITADGIEAARRTCGGHGYSKFSGLPTLFQNYVQNVTWEGDNNVLFLQTARYLLKARHSKGAATGSAAYLTKPAAGTADRCSAKGPDCWNKPEVQLAALRARVQLLADEATAVLASAAAKSAGVGAAPKLAFEGPVWNANSVALIRLAQAHCHYVVTSTFHSALDAWSSGVSPASSTSSSASAPAAAPSVSAAPSVASSSDDAAAVRLPPSSLSILRTLAALFGTSTLEPGAAELLASGYASAAQIAALRAAQRGALSALRPHAVPLVDAFGLEDYSLHSALGRADGDVYRALLEMATPSPLNASQEGPAWEGVLKRVMTAQQSGTENAAVGRGSKL